MLSVAASLQAVLDRAAPRPPVRVPLAQAAGRFLSAAALADLDSPPFDASAMDGYACRRAAAGRTLRVVGQVLAGGSFSGAVGPGECVRIFTGAPVPAGADCVVMQEDVTREGDLIRVPANVESPYIRRRGENRCAGDVVVASGTRLGPPELAALAMAGVVEPAVGPIPRVVHLVTGSELVAPESAPVGSQIRDSNSTLVAALVAAAGVEMVRQVRLRDDLPAALECVCTLPPHDLLLVSGGAGHGEADFTRELLAALGYGVHFGGVNLRPGKPLIFASRGEQLAFGLPGNPVSHWVTFQLFVAPLLRHWQGGVAAAPRLLGKIAPGGRWPAPDGRPTYWPGRAVLVGGLPALTPCALASSGDSGGLVGANALVPLEGLAPGALTTGATVEFIFLP